MYLSPSKIAFMLQLTLALSVLGSPIARPGDESSLVLGRAATSSSDQTSIADSTTNAPTGDSKEQPIPWLKKIKNKLFPVKPTVAPSGAAALRKIPTTTSHWKDQIELDFKKSLSNGHFKVPVLFGAGSPTEEESDADQEAYEKLMNRIKAVDYNTVLSAQPEHLVEKLTEEDEERIMQKLGYALAEMAGSEVYLMQKVMDKKLLTKYKTEKAANGKQSVHHLDDLIEALQENKKVQTIYLTDVKGSQQNPPQKEILWQKKGSLGSLLSSDKKSTGTKEDSKAGKREGTEASS